ncbi:MAG: AAA family ATPase [Bacteroides sp.]
MNKIEINRFKAFARPIHVEADGHNLLVYGENGAGKSSLFEAIYLYYFGHRHFRQSLLRGVRRDRQQELNRFWQEYIHRDGTDGTEVEIQIDDHPIVVDAPVSPSQACALLCTARLSCQTDIPEEDRLNLRRLCERMAVSGDLPPLDTEQAGVYLREVNRVLQEEFREACTVGLDNDEYDLYLASADGHLRASRSLHRYFNEARINLVVLLLHLVIARRALEGEEKPLLVLDDVVTSLDACNRRFLARYLLRTFTGWQVLLFTHNIGFYNLFIRCIEEQKASAQWQLLNLYITRQGPNLSRCEHRLTAAKLRRRLTQEQEGMAPEELCMAIRKRFESVLLEIAKALQIGATERPNYYLHRLLDDGRPCYLKHNKKSPVSTADDLVREIVQQLEGEADDTEKLTAIRRQVAAYSCIESLPPLQAVVSQLHQYEKLFIHAQAHGSGSTPSFHYKEAEHALSLLELLEQQAEALRREVGGM